MVQLEEVPDDALYAQQPGPEKDDEDDWDTDTGNTHHLTTSPSLSNTLPSLPQTQKYQTKKTTP